MSRFFTEVEFPDLPDTTHQRPEKVTVWDAEKLAAAMDTIELELAKIKGGTSELVPRAIDPGKFGFPAQNAIKVFIRDPSDKVFDGIRPIANQDWGARMGKFVVETLLAARTEKTNE